MTSDIVLSSRTFFLPTLSESIFVVSVANRASLVSKYSWCGQPCDLEREEHDGGGGPRACTERRPRGQAAPVLGGGLPRMG